MRVSGKSEAEIAQSRLMPDQVYDAYSMDAEETVSKAGNEMIVMTVVIRLSGSDKTIKDYLTAAAEVKMYSLAKATGNMERYNSGEITAQDLRSLNFRVKTKLEKSRDEQYPDRVVIAEYLPPSLAQAKRPAPVETKPDALDDDQIPF